MRSLLFLLFFIFFISVTEGIWEWGGQCWKWEGEGKYHKDREAVKCQINGVCNVIMKSDGTVTGGCYAVSCGDSDYDKFAEQYPGNHYQQCCETDNCNLIPDNQLALLKSQGVDVDGSGVDSTESSSNKIQQLTSLVVIIVVALAI